MVKCVLLVSCLALNLSMQAASLINAASRPETPPVIGVVQTLSSTSAMIEELKDAASMGITSPIAAAVGMSQARDRKVTKPVRLDINAGNKCHRCGFGYVTHIGGKDRALEYHALNDELMTLDFRSGKHKLSPRSLARYAELQDCIDALVV